MASSSLRNWPWSDSAQDSWESNKNPKMESQPTEYTVKDKVIGELLVAYNYPPNDNSFHYSNDCSGVLVGHKKDDAGTTAANTRVRQHASTLGFSQQVAPAPFLCKTYEMVEDPTTGEVVSWSATNNSFVVWQPAHFSRRLLPQFFKHDNFASFVRQLNTYGFRKVDPDRWEFAHERFLRGQRHLLSTIQRRKVGPSPPTCKTTLTKTSWIHGELQSLNNHKNSIMLDVMKLSDDNQATLQEVESISKRLQASELWQQDMIALFAKTLQSVNQFSHARNEQKGLVDNGKRRRMDKLAYETCCSLSLGPKGERISYLNDNVLPPELKDIMQDTSKVDASMANTMVPNTLKGRRLHNEASWKPLAKCDSSKSSNTNLLGQVTRGHRTKETQFKLCHTMANKSHSMVEGFDVPCDQDIDYYNGTLWNF